MKLLSFGHLPSWAGGRQDSGLANVIYQLAKHCSEIDSADVSMAATDSFVPMRMDGKLTVIGWTKSGLLCFALSHPLSAVMSGVHLLSLKRRYRLKESSGRLFLKRIFFVKAIRNVNPDIVHFHGPSAAWYLDLVPETTKVAVTFHGMTGLDSNLKQHEVLYHMEQDVFLSDKVDRVFFISTQLVSDFKEAYGDNGKNNRVIFNSYDNTQFFFVEKAAANCSHAAKHRINLCTVASLSDLKGQSRVLSALAAVPNKESFHYCCVGGDSNGLAGKLKEYAESNDISFEYFGKKPPQAIRTILEDVDFMIMPSSSEGFGLSYLEAIACGVPVILPRNIPIAKEKNLINDNNSILLEDCSARSIASVLTHIDDYIFNKKDVASSIGGLSWEQVACQYVKAFEELL